MASERSTNWQEPADFMPTTEVTTLLNVAYKVLSNG